MFHTRGTFDAVVTLRSPDLATIRLALALVSPSMACAAAPASVAGMSVASTTTGAGARAALKLGDVEGGRPTLRLWSTQVSNQNLRAALEASLQVHGLLCPGAEAPFTLRTVLADMQQDLDNLRPVVTAYVHYTVADSHGATVFDRRITTQGTATLGDGLNADKRVRIAMERSVRANIEALIKVLAAGSLCQRLVPEDDTMRVHIRLCGALVCEALSACATVPPMPAHMIPRAYEAADRAPAGQGSTLVDVTNAAAEVRVLNHAARCATPCVLMATQGAQELEFSYRDGVGPSKERAPIIFSAEPQVYRRTVSMVEVRSRPGRIAAVTLLILSAASVAAAMGLLTADDETSGVVPARRGLGIGSLAMVGGGAWLARWSVRTTTGVGTQFPWTEPPAPAP